MIHTRPFLTSLVHLLATPPPHVSDFMYDLFAFIAHKFAVPPCVIRCITFRTVVVTHTRPRDGRDLDMNFLPLTYLLVSALFTIEC